HHPHVPGVVPGGGLSLDGTRWIACRPGFFLPVRVLSRFFRRTRGHSCAARASVAGDDCSLRMSAVRHDAPGVLGTAQGVGDAANRLLAAVLLALRVVAAMAAFAFRTQTFSGGEHRACPAAFDRPRLRGRSDVL
ncbi:MAG: transposase, partial [Acidobacteriota bacterium]